MLRCALFIVCTFTCVTETTAQSRNTQRGTSTQQALPEIIKIETEGVGIDPDSATKNAAENALKIVLGSFLQSDLKIREESELKNGMFKETSQVSSTIREYSQGSIAEINILDIKKDGQLTRVKALIAVRKENFEGFVRQVVDGKGKIDEGLFADVQTTRQNQTGQKDSIVKSVLDPIYLGEVMEITVGKPIPFAQSIVGNARTVFKDRYDHFLEAAARNQLESTLRNLQGLGLFGDKNGFFVFPVRISLKEDFKKHMFTVFNNVAAKGDPTKLGRSIAEEHFKNKGTRFAYYQMNNVPLGEIAFNEFRISAEWYVNQPIGLPTGTIRSPMARNIGRDEPRKPTVAIISKSGEVLWRSHIDRYGKEYAFLSAGPPPRPIAGTLVSTIGGVLSIFPRDDFSVLVKISDQILRDASSIQITYDE